MIFRSIQRRRIRRMFGEFFSEEGVDKVMSELSEWDCFIQSLPRWAVPIFRRRRTDEELAASLAIFDKAARGERGEGSR